MSDPIRHREYERRFKLPFEHSEPERCSGLAFLCVQNMLLTGFDAPLEQILYLDRFIRDQALLQAIARVNRKYAGKSCGYIVDYLGIAQALKEALRETETSATGDGGDQPSRLDELPRLEERHREVVAIFTNKGIADLTVIEACVDLLADAKIRADFIQKRKSYPTTE